MGFVWLGYSKGIIGCWVYDFTHSFEDVQQICHYTEISCWGWFWSFGKCCHDALYLAWKEGKMDSEVCLSRLTARVMISLFSSKNVHWLTSGPSELGRKFVEWCLEVLQLVDTVISSYFKIHGCLYYCRKRTVMYLTWKYFWRSSLMKSNQLGVMCWMNFMNVMLTTWFLWRSVFVHLSVGVLFFHGSPSFIVLLYYYWF